MTERRTAEAVLSPMMLKTIAATTPTLFITILFFFSSAAVYAQQNKSPDLSGTDVFAGKHFVSEVSDGCTFWFDGDYEDCCTRHDSEYRQSGLNWRIRLRADNRFFICIAKKKGIWHLALAPVMWTGVRIFGSDLIPLSSRNVIHKFSKRAFRSFTKKGKSFRRAPNRKDGSKTDRIGNRRGFSSTEIDSEK